MANGDSGAWLVMHSDDLTSLIASWHLLERLLEYSLGFELDDDGLQLLLNRFAPELVRSEDPSVLHRPRTRLGERSVVRISACGDGGCVCGRVGGLN
jgi:hypothetical protein